LPEIAIQAAKIMTIPFATDAAKTIKQSLDIAIDPVDVIDNEQELTSINSILKEFNLSIELKRAFDKRDYTYKAPEKTDGIVYRPSLPYIITLAHKPVKNEETIQLVRRDVFYLPNEAPIESIGLKRAALVQKKQKISFTKGKLTEVNITKPSEALDFVQIPIDVLKSIASIPTTLVQYRYNYSSENATLYQNLQRELEDRQKYIEYLQQIQTGNSSGSQASPGSTRGRSTTSNVSSGNTNQPSPHSSVGEFTRKAGN
jgi:hypothetical protein